jgi:hypothetical protein
LTIELGFQNARLLSYRCWPPFNFELGQRVHQRGLDHRGFFVGELFLQAGFGAAPGFVSEDGDAVAGDFHKAFADRQELFVAALANVRCPTIQTPFGCRTTPTEKVAARNRAGLGGC